MCDGAFVKSLSITQRYALVNEIETMGDGHFQEFARNILPFVDSKYKNIEPVGGTYSGKTRPSTSDGIKMDADGRRIAAQYSTRGDYWMGGYSKIHEDIEKCKAKYPNDLGEVVLVSDKRLPSNKDNLIKDLQDDCKELYPNIIVTFIYLDKIISIIEENLENDDMLDMLKNYFPDLTLINNNHSEQLNDIHRIQAECSIVEYIYMPRRKFDGVKRLDKIYDINQITHLFEKSPSVMIEDSRSSGKSYLCWEYICAMNSYHTWLSIPCDSEKNNDFSKKLCDFISILGVQKNREKNFVMVIDKAQRMNSFTGPQLFNINKMLNYLLNNTKINLIFITQGNISHLDIPCAKIDIPSWDMDEIRSFIKYNYNDLSEKKENLIISKLHMSLKRECYILPKIVMRHGFWDIDDMSSFENDFLDINSELYQHESKSSFRAFRNCSRRCNRDCFPGFKLAGSPNCHFPPYLSNSIYTGLPQKKGFHRSAHLL